MRNFKLILRFAAFAYCLFVSSTQSPATAQDYLISPEAWGCSGDHFSQNKVEMGWTLGEVMTETFERNGYYLTQGFHQSDDVFLNVYAEKQQQLVITPNGDGLNDGFLLEDILNYPRNEIVILNRWGSPVFRAKPYLNDWHGTNEGGQPLPEATYYYYVKLDVSKNEILFGSITIKR